MDNNIKIKTGPAQAGYRQREVWRPKSAQTVSDRAECPHCGEEIMAGYAICPHCGRSLTPGKCSFCGSAMKETAKFCTHCGQGREGIVCPECGTLNSRNFCRVCNAPLTRMAQQAMAAAKNDPAFKAVQAKVQELAELRERIEELKNAEAPEKPRPELSEADKALLNEYADILNAIGAPRPKAKPQAEERQRPVYEENVMSLDEIMAAYREKAEEMNAALAALTPPPEFTPEQQRDYFSARKIATKVTEYDMSGYKPSLWVCNYCGFKHNCPSECCSPELGGTWIYITPEQYIENNAAYIAGPTSLKID